MNSDDAQEPSLNELYHLSALANIAYASRCARRVEPNFHMPAEEPDADKMKAVVNMSIQWAENYVQQGTGSLERGQTLTELAWAVAEVSYEHGNFCAYAAHHAVRGACHAARSLDTLTEETFLEVVTAAFGSSRVLLSNSPPWARSAVAQSLRTDFQILLGITKDQAAKRGDPFDPTSAGPLGRLWPSDAPVW